MRLRTRILALVLLLMTPGMAAGDTSSPALLEIDGFPLALSPDGTSVAGVDGAGSRFCVWDIATHDAACDDGLPAPIEARSVTWAQDSSAVVFSLGSSSTFVDSDIYLFDVPGGVLRNLTDDDMNGTGADPVSVFLRAQEAFSVDVFPAWSPDSASLLFARTILNDKDARAVTLMTIPRDGGEPQTHTVLDGVAMLGITGPMHWREDGSIVLTTRHPDPTDTSTAIRLIDTDGVMTTLVDGSADGPITDPVIASMSADGSVVSAWSRLDFHEGLWAEGTPIFFHVDVENGTATPWNAYPGVDMPDGARLLAPPVFGPDGSVAFLWRVRGGDMGISVLDASGPFPDISEVAYTPSGFTPRNVNGLSPTLQWADDGTLLVILATGGTLIPLGQSQATPAG